MVPRHLHVQPQAALAADVREVARQCTFTSVANCILDSQNRGVHRIRKTNHFSSPGSCAKFPRSFSATCMFLRPPSGLLYLQVHDQRKIRTSRISAGTPKTTILASALPTVSPQIETSPAFVCSLELLVSRSSRYCRPVQSQLPQERPHVAFVTSDTQEWPT